MKLLIVTQKVDKNDPILGFFHHWIEEFAKHCERLMVICLGKGEYNLPKNTKVLSLGKEENRGGATSVIPVKVGIQLFFSEKFKKLKYTWRFYKYIRKEKDNYDHVFVHMNQEYVLLGALFWKTWGKKIFMWRNHPNGTFLTDMAVWFSDKVFCTSKYSYTAKFKKTEIMPVGIDTDFFKRDEKIEKKNNSILFLGRISPVKKVNILIEALGILKKKGIDFSASIIGDPLPKDKEFLIFLKNRVSELKLKECVEFRDGVINTETLNFYNKYKIFVNMTPSGSFDKTILEAMACEELVLISNLNLRGEIKDCFIFKENDHEDMASKLEYLIKLNEIDFNKHGQDLRKYVIDNHGLNLLISKLLSFV